MLGVDFTYKYLDWYQMQIPDNTGKWEDVPLPVREFLEL